MLIDSLKNPIVFDALAGESCYYNVSDSRSHCFEL
jgi:hypothetical protein